MLVALQVSEGRVLTECQGIAVASANTPNISCDNTSLTWQTAADFLASGEQSSFDINNLWSEKLEPLFELRACAVTYDSHDQPRST